MSRLSLFMKKNKIIKENVTYAATKSLKDENGESLLWDIRPLSTKEDEKIREQCTSEVQVTGKPNLFRPKLDTNEYITKMLVESVVFPDLLDAELQDSYGVKTPEDLLKELIDNPAEYNDFSLFIQKFNGFNLSTEDTIKEAKN